MIDDWGTIQATNEQAWGIGIEGRRFVVSRQDIRKLRELLTLEPPEEFTEVVKTFFAFS